MQSDGAKGEKGGQGKKPYHPPRLVVYGDLRRLTMSKAGTKSDGGGAKPNTRLAGGPT
ncbi:MAG: lasso RiPP family leader peptide-containing protein [Planctomycetes bacterium]|nr:lasso RiPP family leader peptide-containing protein [Planctomycetota bacterium]